MNLFCHNRYSLNLDKKYLIRSGGIENYTVLNDTESLDNAFHYFFNENNIEQNINIMNIEKNSEQWNRIERVLYKNILIKLNEYKMSMLDKNSEIVNELSKNLI